MSTSFGAMPELLIRHEQRCIVSTVTLAQRITAARKAKGLTQYRLAKLIGIPQSQLGAIEKGRNKNPSADLLGRIAASMDVPTDSLLGILEPEPLIPPGLDHDAGRELTTEELPMKGISSGGDWIESEELTETYPVLRHRNERRPKGERFVVRVAGDSMFPAIHSGDLVLFETTDKVPDGAIAVVQKGNEGTTVKRVYRQKGGALLLRGENPSFRPMETQPGEAKVIAKFLRIVEGKR